MLTSVDSSIFSNAESVTMTPAISAEWNHNLFNPPYITVAGSGIKITPTLTSGTVSLVTSGGRENFTTNSFVLAPVANSTVSQRAIKYSASSLTGKAYKIITYVKSDSSDPIIINAYGEGLDTQFGSAQVEVSSLGWEKIIVYVGTSSADADTVSSLDFTILATTMSGNTTTPTVMFTLPEIYETTLFDYKNHSLFPTESPFSFFRPGESYVTTGDSSNSEPSLYRKITKNIISKSTDKFYSPVSPILQNPTALFANPKVPILKHAAPTNTSPYKYFVSDSDSRSISAMYSENIAVNKVVIKVNTLATRPKFNIKINNTDVTINNSTNIELPKNSEDFYNGVLILYWNGSSWTQNKWSTMPTYNDNGSLTLSTTINKITVTQVSDPAINSQFQSYSSTYLTNDLKRMHLVEISPRLEIDLSSFVINFSAEKSLDSKSSSLPISGTNSNAASISLSGIPLVNGSSIVPIFSSQNNLYNTAISKMLRKGIKFYTGYKLTGYSNSTGNIALGISSYIPAGTFYSDSWDESDIDSVSIQCFDISRYLQSLPAPDYVVNQKNAFDLISDILDLAGFTDYDFDSLYNVCNDSAQPLDVYYYSVYSKDTTLISAINEILTPYQIAAYIDEYGIMKFLSLQTIMLPQSSPVSSISDSNVIQGGFSIQNKAKPGKISIKYTEPKIKQSLGLRNVNDTNIRNSPSFVYVTSNDILWEQQKLDSVGFQYVKDGIAKNSTTLNTSGADQDSIFYTYNRDANGYAIIEDEIVSIEYKEYTLETVVEVAPVPPSEDPTYEEVTETVSIKNNLELQYEINKFIKKHGVALRISSSEITGASSDGTNITYTSQTSFKVGDQVSIKGVNPAQFNVSGTIKEVSPTTFTIEGNVPVSYISGGEAVIKSTYDITVTPTGNITNIKRGLFGTVPKEHKRATSLASKGLSAEVVSDATGLQPTTSIYNIKTGSGGDTLYPSIDSIRFSKPTGSSGLVYHIDAYPENHVDIGYHTYSVKFTLPTNASANSGLFFNDGNDEGIRVSLNKYSLIDPKTAEPYSTKKYQYWIYIQNHQSGEVYYAADITSQANFIISNFVKIPKKTKNPSGSYSYTYIRDEVWDLQVAWERSDGSTGENGTPAENQTILHVFLNGIKISGWQEPGNLYDSDTNPFGTGLKEVGYNEETTLPKNPSLSILPTTGTRFGFYTRDDVEEVETLYPPILYEYNYGTVLSDLREIYATVKPLLSRSINYFLQDPEFLNGLLQDKPAALNSPSYIMQTTPEIKMINVYDFEYGIPAAITANHSLVQYMWKYYAGTELSDKNTDYKKLVDLHSLSYSTLINAGHSGRIAIANNSSHQVWIKKEADSVNNFSINFTAYTNEAIVPSDPELIEYVVDPGNASEVVQMDTKWIQSKTSARTVMKLIEQGLTGFAKDISLKMFGNPLLQVGDIVTFSYSLNGISQQKCIISSVSHSFDNGLSTSITLNRLQA
jgi:hypothetical protein